MNRGVLQLQRLKMCFCDWSGSSNGIRDFVKTDDFYSFVNTNKSVNFEFYLRRGNHPFIKAIYANGFQKDISLKNKTDEEVMMEFNKLKENFGRISIPHAGVKVFSNNKSIQGQWESNMWDNHPRHEILEFMPMKEHKFTWEMYGAERPYLKKKNWGTFTKKLGKRSRTTFNDL